MGAWRRDLRRLPVACGVVLMLAPMEAPLNPGGYVTL
jgi:hypothetical protein